MTDGTTEAILCIDDWTCWPGRFSIDEEEEAHRQALDTTAAEHGHEIAAKDAAIGVHMQTIEGQCRTIQDQDTTIVDQAATTILERDQIFRIKITVFMSTLSVVMLQ